MNVELEDAILYLDAFCKSLKVKEKLSSLADIEISNEEILFSNCIDVLLTEVKLNKFKQ